MLLPLIMVSVAWFPELMSTPGIPALLVGAVGLGSVITFEIRRLGQELQTKLFQQWGGPPTTVILRHGNVTLSEAEKSRFHEALQKVAGVPMPTAAQEQSNPALADERYGTAIAWLREKTRDASKFAVIAGENATYGFYRNLRALRVHGIVGATTAVAGGAVLLFFAFSWGAVIAVVVGLVCLFVFLVQASDVQVKAAAFTYALALIRALDALT